MTRADEHLVFAGTSDIAGIMRGKSFPVSEWEKRALRGVGWTPTNVQITCFGTISESPFGSLGDLALIPDPATRFTLDNGGDILDFALGDITSLEGKPWVCCTRSLAKAALKRLHNVSGATPLAAFEHEFQIKDRPPRPGDSYGFKGYRDAKDWSVPFFAALAQANCQPDTFMKEYGPGQYEVTIKPSTGITAADNAAILRIVTEDVLARFDHAATFAPIIDPESVGNGVHIHISLNGGDGAPLSYDANDAYGMSQLTRHFIGGVLKYLDQFLAILAPSEISYLRLTPHRWSAAFNNLGYRDREASVRICPVSAKDEESIARQFNFEVRAMDAAASPHLAYAALLFAGSQGIKDQIEPPPVSEEDLSLLAPAELASRGYERLPQSLGEALARMDGSSMVRSWFGDEFTDIYIAHKRGEMAAIEGLSWQEKCDRYKAVY